MKVLARISRIIIGLVFIFSGFVKSVDPYGTAYKIEEYLNVFGLNSLVNSLDWLPIVSSIILCSFETVGHSSLGMVLAILAIFSLSDLSVLRVLLKML